MYKIGHRQKKLRHHIAMLAVIFLVVLGISAGLFWNYMIRGDKTEIKQTTPTTTVFDPSDTKKNIKIDTPLYYMELPKDWKEIARNYDTRYNSIKWQYQGGIKNRWIELFTDRVPTDMAYNRIIPVTITDNKITPGSTSENCSNFTNKQNDGLKVLSKWDNVSFLCDFSNLADNVIGVSSKQAGTTLSFKGPQTGEHTYLFVYTDRSIPEDGSPFITALESFTPK